MPNNTYLLKQTNWQEKYYYQKSDVIYQMTVAFCNRFVPLKGDRTRDQMIQAARSCKQNIVEGLADGVTSTEMMSKLINVARASLQELLEDYKDYCKAHDLVVWDKAHPRFNGLLDYCKRHNKLDEYQQFFSVWNDEEFCNTALSLCHIVDKMLFTLLKKLEQTFVEQGGMKERMYKARTGYRNQQDEELNRLRQENPILKAEINRLRTLLKENNIEY